MPSSHKNRLSCKGALVTRRLLLGATASFAAMMPAMTPLPAWADRTTDIDKITHDPDVPVLGNPEGDVTIVEFFDYQCPVCKVSYRDLKALINEDGNLRVVMKDWPIFGAVSKFAAQMALAANGQDKYAEAVEALLTVEATLSPELINTRLEEAGIDLFAARIDYTIRQETIKAVLERNAGQAEMLDLPGTPCVMIGNRLHKRYMKPAALRAEIALVRKQMADETAG